MRVLVIGSGGREHALVWKISQSKSVSFLCAAPGNAGIAKIAKCFAVGAEDVDGLVKLAVAEKIDLVVVGPEVALSLGVSDKLRELGIATFGPSQAAAQLESSKAFSKDFMARQNIPTAAYGVFTQSDAAIKFLETLSAPYVLKASGLAAGKGVVIAETLEQAKEEVAEMLSGKFGDASSELVIEEFMNGEEASFFVLCNSKNIIPLPVCQDHKRAFDNDEGLNTGGMGAYAPTTLVDENVKARIMQEIVIPSVEGMAREGNPYNGVLYVGLMIKDGVPRVVEYNCRFGDPECQILMQFMPDDFAEILEKIAREEKVETALDFTGKSAVTVVMAAKGYPESYEKNGVINNIENAEKETGAFVFHAGTKVDDAGQLRANGGRVLNVTANGDTLQDALDRAYAAVKKIDAPSLFYRNDIGQKEIRRNK